MRQRKEDTIAKFRDEFLAGKKEAYRELFDQKTKEQQYIAIMNWKRNAKKFAESSGELAKASIATVVNHLKDAHKSLSNMSTLTPKDAAKVQTLIDSVKSTIDNFDKVKKQQEITALKNLKKKLQRQGDKLTKKIEQLQLEIG